MSRGAHVGCCAVLLFLSLTAVAGADDPPAPPPPTPCEACKTAFRACTSRCQNNECTRGCFQMSCLKDCPDATKR